MKYRYDPEDHRGDHAKAFDAHGFLLSLQWAATRAALSQMPEVKELIRHATLAASNHNTQPWRFRIGEGRVEILPDFSRRTPVVDPDDHHLFASLGCAAENLAIAAEARCRAGELRFDPADDGSVMFAFGTGPIAGSALK